MSIADMDQKIWTLLQNKRQAGKSRFAEVYNNGRAVGDSKRFNDMRCIGGSVIISGHEMVAQRKLFIPRGKARNVVYVKSARERFSPLCVNGTLSNGRTWSDLKLPDGFMKVNIDSEGGHIVVGEITLMARERVLGEKTPSDLRQILR